MTDFTAKIRSKGLDATGVTEDTARAWYSALGSHHVAVVEVQIVDRRDNANGNHSVEAVITQFEPASSEYLDDHLREVMRALYRGRRTADGVLGLPGVDDGRTVNDVVDAGKALLDHDSDGEVIGLWDGNTDAPLPEKSAALGDTLPDLPASAYPPDAKPIPASDDDD